MISILYVDDEPALLEICKLYLEKDGEFAVDIVNSSHGALGLLDSQTYDAIVSDYQMPGMDGIELLKHIRKNHGDLPFIIFTGKGREEVVIEALNEGADFYLQKGGKPVPQFAELSNKIRYAVTRRKAVEAVRQNEAQLRQIIDLVPHMIFAKDWDGNYILANRKVAEIYNTSVADLVGKPQNLFHQDPAQLRQMLDDDHEVLAKGTMKSVPEEPFIDAFGNARVLQTTKVPFITPGHLRWAVLGVGIDITDQKRIKEELSQKNEELHASYEQIAAVEQELRSNLEDLTRQGQALQESEAKFRGIFDMVSDGIHIHEIEADGKPGKFVEVNDAVIRKLQYTREELLEMTPLDLATVCHSKPVDQIFHELTTNGHSFFETGHRRKDGAVIPVEVNTRVVDLMGRRLVASVVRDISDRKRTETELRMKNDELNASYEQIQAAEQELTANLEDLTRQEQAVREREAELRAILESTADGILAVDNNGKVMQKNQRFLEIWKIPDAIAKSRNDRELLNFVLDQLTDPEAFLAKVEALYESDAVDKDTLLFRDGRIVERHSSPMMVDGALAGRVWSFRDITAQKQVENTIRERDAELRAIFNVAQVGIMLVDAGSHRIIHANAKALSLIGAAAEEVTGAVCHRFICPALIGRCPVTDLGQEINSSERVLVRKDGTHVPVIKSVVRAELGGKKVLLESFIDISAQKEVEKSLRESETWQRDLISTTYDILWDTDEKARFVHVSPQVEKILGYTPDELIGKCPADFMEPSRVAASREPFEKAAGNPGTLVSADAYWFHKDGHRVILETRALPVFLPDGTFAGFRGIDRDITERRLAEEELRELNQKLNLLSLIARHDISNQLLVLQGHLGLLEGRVADPAAGNRVREAMAATDRIAGMIQFTRDYEKIGAGEPAWQDCRALVSSAVKEVPGGPVVKNDLPAGAELYADPLIARVFSNLIDNAARHGGKISALRFFVKEAADPVIVCEDDGNGVPAREKKKIFERGFGKHTGLGLFLSREILKATGITIAETGKPGMGARFEMNVPEGAYRRKP